VSEYSTLFVAECPERLFDVCVAGNATALGVVELSLRPLSVSLLTLCHPPILSFKCRDLGMTLVAA